jgi:hypothetical protein
MLLVFLFRKLLGKALLAVANRAGRQSQCTFETALSEAFRYFSKLVF